ncbi:MAG: ABC transporter ATP-binding protein [Beijerinckiaceae bacterium]
MTAPVLLADNVVKHFGGKRTLLKRDPLVRAVDGVSFQISRGETFAIVGESGCGKSTLARVLLRLIEPTAGRVTYEDRDITNLTPAQMRTLRRDMQIIFQDPFSSLNPRMSIGSLIAEPIQAHAIALPAEVPARVADMLRTVGLLPEHAARYPHEFSGGQRQRIGIARALASQPKFVVGDEPVSALDVSIRAQIINLLEDLKEALGLTLLLVSHDLGVVRHTADRVAVMYLGKIVELAPTESLYNHPAHPYTRALMAAIPAQTPAARRERKLLEGDPPSPVAPPSGCRFHPRCPHATSRCSTEEPILRAFADNHTVACHHAETLITDAILPDNSGSPARQKRMAIFASAVEKQRQKNENQIPANGGPSS